MNETNKSIRKIQGMLSVLWKKARTKREKWLLVEFSTEFYSFLWECALDDAEKRGLSYCPPGFKTAAEFRKWKCDYENAKYGKRLSKREREAFDFVQLVRFTQICDEQSGQSIEDSPWLLLPALFREKWESHSGSPVLRRMFELALTQKILKSYSGNPILLKRHPEFKRWALPLTWKEIRQKHFPDYLGSPQNFQKYLKKARVDFEPAGEWRIHRKRVCKRRKNTR
jgi:hypothetical protein